jgi:hypothetical protein
MKNKQGRKEEVQEENIISNQKLFQTKCPFSWEKLLEMKIHNIEFFAGDGFKRLRIIDMDEKARSIYLICELGKITWPLRFDKLEEVHSKIHSGKVDLIPYEIDRLIPTWGNFVAGLFRYFGCGKD